MPRAKNARGKVHGALPRTPARGTPPETPGPLSLLPDVPERSSPSRVHSRKSFQNRKRFSSAAHNPRALDRCGPFRRLSYEKGKRANAKSKPSSLRGYLLLPLVGPARSHILQTKLPKGGLAPVASLPSSRLILRWENAFL